MREKQVTFERVAEEYEKQVDIKLGQRDATTPRMYHIDVLCKGSAPRKPPATLAEGRIQLNVKAAEKRGP